MADHKMCIFYQEGAEPMECAQANVIIEIRQTLAEVSKAMGMVAAQDERLKAHEEKNREQDKSLQILYERVRSHDLVLGQEGAGIRIKVIDALEPFEVQIKRLERILDLICNKYFVVFCSAIALMVLSGTLCDLVYHNEFVTRLWKIAK